MIDLERIALVGQPGALRVVGERKAITPGGGEIEVERLATGAKITGDVANDGSFDVRVDGTLGDAYRLRALGDWPDDAVDPVFLDGEGATERPAELCASCDLPEIFWGRIGPTLGTANTIVGCRQYTAIHTVGEQCEGRLPCLGDGGERAWSELDLRGRLADPEVQSALARGDARFGADGGGGGTGIGIRIGDDRSIMIFDAACDGEPGCEEPPPGVIGLRTLLENIADQQACREICADEPDRVFVAEACVECSPQSVRCISRAPVCAEPCERDEDCTQAPGRCNAEGVCDRVECE